MEESIKIESLPREHTGCHLEIMKGLRVAGGAAFYKVPLNNKSGMLHYCAIMFGDVMRFYCFLKHSP